MVVQYVQRKKNLNTHKVYKKYNSAKHEKILKILIVFA